MACYSSETFDSNVEWQGLNCNHGNFLSQRMKLFSLEDYKQTNKKSPFGYNIAKWSWSQAFIQNVWASSLCEITPPLSPPPVYRTQAHSHNFQSFITNLHTSETGQITRLCLVPYQLSRWLPLSTPGHRGHEIWHEDFLYQALGTCLWSQCPGRQSQGKSLQVSGYLFYMASSKPHTHTHTEWGLSQTHMHMWGNDFQEPGV